MIPELKKDEIRMVVSDLDGTLLHTTGRISKRTKETIRALRRKGILFGVCSGRSAIALRRMLKIWGIENDVDFVLGFNGGMSWDPKTDKIETWCEMEPYTIKKRLRRFKPYGFTYGEYVGEEMWATKKNLITERFAARNRLGFRTVTEQELIQPALKLMAIGMPWKISKFLKENDREGSNWRLFRSGPFLIECVNLELTKLFGITKIAERYGIKPDQIITFGNDNNDLEMLAGTFGVAMDNSIPGVKNAAAAITASNDQDGVARFLQRELLD